MTQGNSRMGLVRILVRRRRMIVLTCAAALVLSTIVSFLIPRRYASTASVLPPESSMSELDAGGTFSAMGFQPALLPMLASPSEVFAAILESRTIAERIVHAFDLRSVYGSKDMTAAQRKLRRRTDIGVSGEGVISVTVEDRDPARASAMANTYVEELDRFNRGTRSTAAGRTRAFIEMRLAETDSSLENAELALMEFRQRTGAIAVPDQARAWIEAAAHLRARLAELEARLYGISSFYSERAPEVVNLKTQIAGLRSQLREMGLDLEAEQDWEILIRLGEAPELEFELEHLLREVEVQRSVLKLLYERYEEARIQEARDTPTVQVLDVAVPADRPSFPKKKILIPSCIALALVASIIWALIRERFSRIPPDSPDFADWQEIKSALSTDLGRLAQWGRTGSLGKGPGER